MPTTDTRDLSILTGSTIPVKLTNDGPTYQLPGDVPIPTILRRQQYVNVLQDDDATELAKGEALQGLYDLVLGLFQVHQPDLTDVPLNARQLVTFDAIVYGGADPSQIALADSAEDDAAPPRSKSSSRKKPAKSRTT